MTSSTINSLFQLFVNPRQPGCCTMSKPLDILEGNLISMQGYNILALTQLRTPILESVILL